MISIVDPVELEHVLRPTVYLPAGGRLSSADVAWDHRGELRVAARPSSSEPVSGGREGFAFQRPSLR